MNPDETRLIMDAFLPSQFAYCPLTWVFHKREVNHIIEYMKNVCVVYRDTTSVFERLQIKDFFVSIHYRIIQALATEILSLQGDISKTYEIGLPTKPTFEL